MTQVKDEQDILLSIVKGIEKASPVGEHRRELWERCWAEYSAPPYFGEIVRVERKFYHAPGYEAQFLQTMREGLYRKYFSTVSKVSEFGCGVGHNLTPLIGQGKKLVGYDWSESACKRVRDQGMEAEVFDMFRPKKVDVDGVLTVHALEQLGSQWRFFLESLIASKPSVCVHIEPIEEFYDQDNLVDYLALQYHSKRRYLAGFLTHLRVRPDVKILEERRSYVGSLFHEAYSVVVWRPI